MVATSYAAVQEGTDRSDEVTLISNARKGDLESFNQLVHCYQDRIYNLAVRILGDPDTASDITQNTFMTAYLKLPQFRNGSFRGWLYRIATNACYDVHRASKRHPVLSIDNEDSTEVRFSTLDALQDQSFTPEAAFERHELERIVQNAINQLEVDHRAVLILVDQQGLDYQEAALILRVPVGTVKSRLARARLRLRQLLSPKLGEIYS